MLSAKDDAHTLIKTKSSFRAFVCFSFSTEHSLSSRRLLVKEPSFKGCFFDRWATIVRKLGRVPVVLPLFARPNSLSILSFKMASQPTYHGSLAKYSCSVGYTVPPSVILCCICYERMLIDLSVADISSHWSVWHVPCRNPCLLREKSMPMPTKGDF